MFKCETCGKEFEKDWRKDQRKRHGLPRFCCKRCANKHNHLLMDSSKLKDAKCKVCGKDIKVRNNNSAHGCLCIECKKEKAKERSHRYYASHQEKYKLYNGFESVKENIYIEPKTCLNCGKEFRLKNKKFCCKDCNREYHKKQLLESLTNERDNVKISETVIRRHVKDHLIEKYGNKCAICGTQVWNNKPIPLICDHINGDPSDNRLENFRLVCPNCDAQLPTFKSKNKGNGRKSKGIKN